MASFRRSLTTLGSQYIQGAHRSIIAYQAHYSMLSKTCDPNTVDLTTHTGQKYSEDDYRRIRFTDKEKLVNQNFAIDLIAEDPVVVVNAKSIYSNGGGALGHPRVFINLNKPQISVCGYSGRKFIQKKFYKEAEHGPFITYEEYIAQGSF